MSFVGKIFQPSWKYFHAKSLLPQKNNLLDRVKLSETERERETERRTGEVQVTGRALCRCSGGDGLSSDAVTWLVGRVSERPRNWPTNQKTWAWPVTSYAKSLRTIRTDRETCAFCSETPHQIELSAKNVIFRRFTCIHYGYQRNLCEKVSIVW